MEIANFGIGFYAEQCGVGDNARNEPLLVRVNEMIENIGQNFLLLKNCRRKRSSLCTTTALCIMLYNNRSHLLNTLPWEHHYMHFSLFTHFHRRKNSNPQGHRTRMIC